jgi:hypothetical protein
VTNVYERRRSSLRFAAALIATSLVAAAPLPPAWNHWRYSRVITVPPNDAPQLVSVILPRDAYTHVSRGLLDVRVIDDRGDEIPFVIFSHEGTKSTKPLPTLLRENSFAPGLYTQVVLDTGAANLFHNGVQIETPETDFIEWVQVEVSDDARAWRLVEERAPIFRFRKDRREGSQLVSYSDSNARYLRARILNGKSKFLVTGAKVLYKAVDPPERAAVAADMSLDSSAPVHETVWRTDLGSTTLKINQVQFDGAASEFSRSVNLESSKDGKNWQYRSSGEIYRFHQEDIVRERLVVDVSNYEPMRFWRVAIVNGNDAPLPGVRPTLYMTPRHIVFEQQPGRTYRLLYGQEFAKSPSYDLERRLNSKTIDAAEAGQLGEEELNTAWSDPRPWTEKYEIVLWLAIGIAVLLLGYSAIRSLRRSAAQDPAS